MDTSLSYSDGLRELADWLDAHPEWVPFTGEYLYSWQHNADLSTMVRAARDMGTAEKVVNENTGTFKLVKRFGPHAFSILADRAAVCERVVKGHRVVKRVEKVPVGDVLYTEREVEEVVEEVEWVCPPSILGAAGS